MASRVPRSTGEKSIPARKNVKKKTTRKTTGKTTRKTSRKKAPKRKTKRVRRLRSDHPLVKNAEVVSQIKVVKINGEAHALIDDDVLEGPVMTGGRPPKYESPSVMEAKIKEYFTERPPSDVPVPGKIPSIIGLCAFLGFCDRISFFQYAQKYHEFTNTIKRAKALIEQSRVERGSISRNFPFEIFMLKTTHGFEETSRQKHEIELDIGVKPPDEDETSVLDDAV